MEENSMNDSKKYVGYEYKTVVVRREMEGLWTDSYKNMGWELEKSCPAVVKHVWGPIRLLVAPLAIFPKSHFSKMVKDHDSETNMELTFKRDRNMDQKTELNRLQMQFENAADVIDKLEESKKTGASVLGYTVGLLGTVFLACATFAYLKGMLIPCIVLAIPGFLGWILPYFCYTKVRNKKVKNVTPLIDRQYDMIYETCEKACSLFA